ncbi:MAG: PAS domain-containing protein [Halobacteriota archaeon]
MDRACPAVLNEVIVSIPTNSIVDRTVSISTVDRTASMESIVRSRAQQLPAFDSNAEQPVREYMFDATNPGSDRLRVLVVDGRSATCERLESALERSEYRVRTVRAESGATARSTLADGAYDAIVVSEKLSGDESGVAFLRRLSGEDSDGISIVFVSDSADEMAIDAAIEYGANRCVSRVHGSDVWYRILAEAVVSEVESRRTRSRLERTTDELNRIYDTVPVMITRKDANNRLLTVNEAVTEYVGLPREAIEGNFAEDLFPEQSDEFHEMDRQVIDSGEPIENEVQPLTTPSGETRWMKTDVLPYRSGDGGVDGVLIVSEDVTELKAREEELARQNERLDRFVSVVSHDLRNPLSIASGRLHLAQTECDCPHLQPIQAALERMATLIEDLLELARDGDAVSELESIGTSTLVDRCWATVDTVDAILTTDLDRTIRADEGRLRQLFENLFRNAIEHGGTDVTVTVGETDEGFYVADDGDGILEGERERVFDPGYSSASGGTGFGLSIVKEIADAHGWDVRVTESADGGARFDVAGVEFDDG